MQWYDDISVRNHVAAARSAMPIDVYIAGFPCQSFSVAGIGAGVTDTSRGVIVKDCIATIAAGKPKVFILENVKGLLTQHGKTLQVIIVSLKKLPYDVMARILNTCDHGIPQNRERIYIIGIRKDCNRSTFSWPPSIGSVDLKYVLDPAVRLPSAHDLPPVTQKSARRQLLAAMATIVQKGHHPFREDFVIDVGSSKFHMMLNKSPCMTRSRAGGHWLSSRGRFMTTAEMLRLNGFDPKLIHVSCVSPNQLGRLIGNAMSVNVLERLLLRLLPSAGIIESAALVGRWETMAIAQRSMTELARPGQAHEVAGRSSPQ